MDTIVAIDLETTGLDPIQDSIIEIGAVKFNGTRIEAQWETLINPRRAIPQEITGLTGISNDMVRNAPLLQDVRQDLEAFVGDALVLGHNVQFDLGFLQQRGILQYSDWIDTYALASVLMPSAGRYNLGALAEALRIPLPATHRALDDALATHAVFMQLWQRALDLPLDLVAELVRVGDHLDWGAGWIFHDVLRTRSREKIGARQVAQPDDFGPLFPHEGGHARERFSPLVADPDPIHVLDPDELAAILEHGGAFSRHFPQFEHRVEQVEMLRQVAWALSDNRHLMVEAGTGTGKSVAYLIPAAFHALENNTRVVVSTNTINLQEQLVTKDIPNLIEALGIPLRAAVLKGRGNYLCPRRLTALRRAGPETNDEMRVLAKVLVWQLEDQRGDRNSINLRGAGERMVWERISASDDNCTNDTCSSRMGGICPFYRAKQAAGSAHILIVNHALLLADVATGSRVLPDYQYLIIDEAHHMESAVTNALSFRATRAEIDRMMRELGGTNAGTLGRLLASLAETIEPGHYAMVHQLVDSATTHAYHFQNGMAHFFVTIESFLEEMREGQEVSSYGQQVRILPATRTQPAWMEVETSWEDAEKGLRQLMETVKQIGTGLGELLDMGYEAVVDEYGNLGNLFRRLEEFKMHIDGLVFSPKPDSIYWVEIQGRGRQIALQAAPLHIGPLMQQHVWHEKNAVVMTSATLTTNGDFEYLRGRLYGEDADTIQLGSPFDYESQAMIYLIDDVPEPSDRRGHQQAVNQGLIRLFRATGGRGLALFTSYAQLRTTSRAISGPLAEQGILVYEQGGGASPHTLLENFKSSEQAVLLGTRAFWEGVDIPGEALSVLAIIKLPFDVPSDPIVASRSETFESPFYEYSIPEAILRFRQGFGRLIRTQYDRGIVAVFDRRVLSKQYGRAFIDSLPPCTVRQGSLHGLAEAATSWLNL